ncbi:HLA class II histocompatibility antigen, DO alpha chain isoform X4 [Mustela putorius furo]|uniref:HLA class II histocompatibility antigen, DO alpha chain isoform X4 n=1 Tax=Mustela putorius furo TaxID=9669 RepID=A0A8U0UY36_MUSPF|nr:HLA class II histocompatibility antigen, DO alpha chain isoform X4 [Mustela putorius furo]
MVLSGGLVLGLYTLMSLLSPQETGAIKDSADHMGSYGPAFYQSYGASGQFAYEFDGEQLFSVELKKKEAVWRLPEFGNLAHFDPQNGLASIAVIKAHLDVLVERSNRTRATNDDMYDCKVEHWGLDEPLLKHWEPQVPIPVPDTTETLICALGLALGLLGFLVGTFLIIRGTCLSRAHR